MSDIEPIQNKPSRKRYTETFLRIQNYWYDTTGKIKLSDSDKAILDRWSFADTQIRLDFIDEMRVPGLMLKKFPHISRSTAYEDIRNAKALFGSGPVEDQMYYSQFHYSLALDGYKRAMRNGKEAAASRFLKLMTEIRGKDSNGLLEEQMREMAEVLQSSKMIFIVDNPERVKLKNYTEEYVAKLEAELRLGKNNKGTGEFTEFEEVKE